MAASADISRLFHDGERVTAIEGEGLRENAFRTANSVRDFSDCEEQLLHFL